MRQSRRCICCCLADHGARKQQMCLEVILFFSKWVWLVVKHFRWLIRQAFCFLFFFSRHIFLRPISSACKTSWLVCINSKTQFYVQDTSLECWCTVLMHHDVRMLLRGQICLGTDCAEQWRRHIFLYSYYCSIQTALHIGENLYGVRYLHTLCTQGSHIHACVMVHFWDIFKAQALRIPRSLQFTKHRSSRH